MISPEMGSMSRSAQELALLPNNESYVRLDFSHHEANRRLDARGEILSAENLDLRYATRLGQGGVVCPGS